MKVYGQLERAQIEGLTSDPTGANLVVGRMWFRTDTQRYKVYDGSAIKEFVDLVEAQTLQNKILDSAQLNTPTVQGATTYNQLGSTPANPSAGNHKVYFKNDGKLYTLDELGNEVEVGAGAGSGSKNYFDDTSANIDNTIGSWETDDGAGSASAGLTLTVTTLAGELLSGAGSLKLVKDAADRNGHFIKVLSETIDPADRGQPLFGSFQFNPITGYASSDLIWEVYDVTNAAVLYSGVAEDLELLNSKGRFNWVTYLEDTTAQVEFRLRINNANTNSFEVSLDEFKFGPTAQVRTVYLKSETIDLTGSADFTGGTLQVERVGNIVTINFFDLTFPSTSNANSSNFVIPEWATPTNFQVNVYSETFQGSEEVQVSNNGAFSVQFRNFSGGSLSKTTASDGSITYAMPEVGSNVVNTHELSLQTVRASMFLGGNQSVNTTLSTKVVFNNVDYDTHNIVDIGNNEFIIPKTGYYKVEMHLNVSSLTADEQFIARIAVNGSEVARTVDRSANSDIACDLSKTLYLNKGDTVSAQVSSTADTSYSVRGSLTGNDSYLQIQTAPDFTVLGAVNNYEILETATTIAHGFTGNANTFYVPTTTFKLDLTPGTWELYAQVYTDVVTTGGNARPEIALSTSTTPGADIIRRENASGGSTTSNIDRTRVTIVKVPEYIVTENTSIYVHVYLLNTSGFTTSSSAQLGSIGNAHSRLMARRLK